MGFVPPPQYIPPNCPIKLTHSPKKVWAASCVSGVDGHAGFLPCSLLETESRQESILAGWGVSYVLPTGPQWGLIAGISTSSLSGQQGPLSYAFLATNFHFLCFRGDGINSLFSNFLDKLDGPCWYAWAWHLFSEMVAILEEEVLKEPIRDRGLTREGRVRCQSGPIRVLWCPEKKREDTVRGLSREKGTLLLRSLIPFNIYLLAS